MCLTAHHAKHDSASDNDLFFGTRLALNDSDDTSVLAGVAVDLDSQEMFLNIEAERRFSDKLSVELQLRTFMNTEPSDALYTIEHDDYLQLRLSWYYWQSQVLVHATYIHVLNLSFCISTFLGLFAQKLCAEIVSEYLQQRAIERRATSRLILDKSGPDTAIESRILRLASSVTQ
jgi:hypothetical protein